MKTLIMTLVFFFVSICLNESKIKFEVVEAPVKQIKLENKKNEKVILKSKLDESLFVKQVSRTGCFKTCKYIINEFSKKLNLPIKVGNSKNVIQVVRESNRSLTQITTDYSYIDQLLSLGIPALVGVHHTYNYGYNEGTTDHFVLIVSKNESDSTYQYFDVGKRNGARSLNQFKIVKNKLINENRKKSKNYVVSQIRILFDSNGVNVVNSESIRARFGTSKEWINGRIKFKCRVS